MVDWNVYGIALVPGAAALAFLSVVIYRSRPSSGENQSLAMMLIGFAMLAGGLAIGYLAKDVGVARGGFGVAYASWFSASVASIRFSASLGVPWLRALRYRWADRSLLLLYFLGPALVVALLLPRTFAGMASYAPYVPWRPVFHPGAFETWNVLSILVNLVAIAAAGHAWQRQPAGSPLRRTMATYFVAALAIETISVASQILRVDIITSIQDGTAPAPWKVPVFILSIVWQMWVYPIGFGYAILKAQVFDVDLRIKWGLRRGTLVGAFLAVFFVVNAMVQQFLEGYGVILGGAAVGLMLFAVRPIERMADRMADHAMPRVQDTHEYRTVRKREVYRAAVDSALEDGGDISPKERGMLATLQDQLGIGARDAHDIEREARAARAGVA